MRRLLKYQVSCEISRETKPGHTGERKGAVRIPGGYEEMIREIAKVAAKYGFHYEKDQLEDKRPGMPKEGHLFRATVSLFRNAGDFVEDAPIPISV
jgi:hypothetical protein